MAASGTDFPERVTRRETYEAARRVSSTDASSPASTAETDLEPALRFTLLVPPTFEGDAPTIVRGDGGFETARFVWRSAARDASIEVRADQLRREVSPGAWARRRLLAEGHTVLQERTKATPIGELADILSAKNDRVARTNMAKDGACLYTITCEARAADWSELAEELLVALSSWKLLEPTRAPLSEPLESFASVLPVIAGYLHPESFALRAERASDEEQTLHLSVDDVEHLAIVIRKQENTDDSPLRIARAVYTAWRGRDDNLDFPTLDAMSPEARAPRDDLSAPLGGRSRGTRLGVPTEHRFQVFTTRGAAAIVAASSPLYLDDPIRWATTERAFELACESLYLVA